MQPRTCFRHRYSARMVHDGRVEERSGVLVERHGDVRHIHLCDAHVSPESFTATSTASRMRRVNPTTESDCCQFRRSRTGAAPRRRRRRRPACSISACSPRTRPELEVQPGRPCISFATHIRSRASTHTRCPRCINRPAPPPPPRQFTAMNTRTIWPIGLRYPTHRPALADCHLRRRSYPCSSNENAA